MATYLSKVGNGWQIRVIISTDSQNVSNNRSVLNWRIDFLNKPYGRYQARTTASLKVAGTTVWSVSNQTLDSGSSGSAKTIASGKITINHNSNGNASASIAAAWKTADQSASWHVPPLSVSATYTPHRIDQLPGKPAAPTVTQNKTTDLLTITSKTAAANGGTILEYQIRRRNYSTGSWSSYISAKADKNRKMTMTPAHFNTSYQFSTRARTARGWGPWSNATKFTTQHAFPNKPGTPTVSQNQSTRLITVTSPVATSAGGAITGYQIRRRNNSTGSWSGWSTATADSNRRISFTPDHFYTDYQFQVRARTARGYGDWSNTTTFKSMASGPAVRVGTSYRPTVAYVRVEGVWRLAICYVKQNGVWKISGG